MITFKSITYKNFQSVGNSGMTIQLNRNRTTVITGKNGNGKSTLQFAIVYALFGKALNGVNVGELVNTTNKKNLLVKLTIMINKDEYLIVRGIKPNTFEIHKNGEMLNQSASVRQQQETLEKLLGFDFDLATQLILLNREKFVPFMELSASGRRKVVEDVLDISLFTNINDVLSGLTKQKQIEINDLEHAIDILNVKIDSQSKLVKALHDSIQNNTDQIKDQIESKEDQLQQIKDKADQISAEMSNISTSGWDKVKSSWNALNDLNREFNLKVTNLHKEMSFFNSHDVCPTCEQEIQQEKKDSIISKDTAELSNLSAAQFNLKAELDKLQAKDDEFQEAQNKYVQLKHDRLILANRITSLQKDIDDLRKNISNKSADSSELDSEIKQTDELCYEQAKNKTFLEDKLEEKSNLSYMKTLLSDSGVKATIVKEYIPLMNKKIAEYLHAMDLYVSMTLDENFNESFHALNKENFSYRNLSSGQRTRVNLAIWLALLEVAAIKNSVSTNLLFLDEILEALDPSGVQQFMSLCRELLYNSNVFVITQRGDEFEDWFESKISFKLNSGFTEIA